MVKGQPRRDFLDTCNRHIGETVRKLFRETPPKSSCILKVLEFSDS